MKQIKKLIILTVILISGVFGIIGCNRQENSENNAVSAENNAESEFSVTDMKGNKITFQKVPDKMVVLLASDVEILYELGAEEKIVAVGEYCDYPEEALEKEIIATGENLNVEQIIEADPDVVVIGEMAQTTDQLQQLEDAGIPVVVTDSQDIVGTYEAIGLMGQLSGKQKEADDLITYMKDSFKEIEDKSNGNDEKTIYFEVSPIEYGLWTTGKDTFMQELADMLAVKNVFEDLTGWVEISEEQVLERNPDYIVTSTMSHEDISPVDEILARENWQNLTAITTKQVYNGDSDMMTRPGPRLVDAAQELYKFIYGE